MKEIEVFVNQKRVGLLSYNREKKLFEFEYDDEVDLSKDFISLVFRKRKRYQFQKLNSIFLQSIPEGVLKEKILNLIAKEFEFDIGESSFLEEYVLFGYVGRNQIGRLRAKFQFLDWLRNEDDLSIDEKEIEDDEVDRFLIFEKYLESIGLYSGVSGVFPKLLANLDDSASDAESKNEPRLSIPLTKYIVKFQGTGYDAICVNEYFCMLAARRCGLNVPNYRLNEKGDVLIVERFDRIDQGFEEMFSLFGYDQPHLKYRGSYEQVFANLEMLISQDRKKDLSDLFKSLILSIIVRNGDMHLKNIAIVYDSSEPLKTIRLAPIYDIVTTPLYIKDDKLALSFLNSKEWPLKDDIVKFGLRIGFDRRQTESLIEQAADAVNETIKDVELFIREKPFYRKSLLKMLSFWRIGLSEVTKTKLTIVKERARKRVRKKKLS